MLIGNASEKIVLETSRVKGGPDGGGELTDACQSLFQDGLSITASKRACICSAIASGPGAATPSRSRGDIYNHYVESIMILGRAITKGSKLTVVVNTMMGDRMNDLSIVNIDGKLIGAKVSPVLFLERKGVFEDKE